MAAWVERGMAREQKPSGQTEYKWNSLRRMLYKVDVESEM
jgi:hypothetical protein